MFYQVDIFFNRMDLCFAEMVRSFDEALIRTVLFPTAIFSAGALMGFVDIDGVMTDCISKSQISAYQGTSCDQAAGDGIGDRKNG